MTTPARNSTHTFQLAFLGWGENQSLADIAEVITLQIQQFLGLDRVMLYRFDGDYNGQVIAEACVEERLPSLRGLHFPSTDIPPQARAYLLKARQRVIVDVAAKHKTLLLEEDDPSRALNAQQDIRYAPVDPCHLQYLLGLGVLSSITYSVVHQGRLWGLLTGHHSDSRYFSEAEIQTVQLWVDQLSVALAQDLLRQQVRQHQVQEQLLSTLTGMMGQERLGADQWTPILQVLMEGLAADGCRLYLHPDTLEDRAVVYSYGVQPALPIEAEEIWPQFQQALQAANLGDLPELGELGQPAKPRDAANLNPAQGQTLTSPVAQWPEQPQGELLAQLFQPTGISAVLVLPIGSADQVLGYLSFYRREATVTITWAGQHSRDPRNQLPRASFAAWQEHQRQVCPWQPTELTLARRVTRHLYMGVMQHWLQIRMQRRSAQDVMTQLPNWLLFSQQLHLAVLQSQRQGKAVAVGILNLDQFKRVNTTYGHTFGNYLLQSVAHRLQQCLNTDLQVATTNPWLMLARWHGDRFALLLPACGGKAELNRHAQTVLNSLSQPFLLQGEEIYLTASLGLAVAPYDGDTTDELVQHAEKALDQARRQGQGGYQIYTPGLGTGDSPSHQMLANDLYRAITQQELVLHYQPQADLDTGNIIGLEVLVRWQHPRLGLVAPEQFIPIAEAMGLMDRLDKWVLRTACRQYGQWRQAGLPPLRLAVNLSATQFESAHLVQMVKEIIKETGIVPQELELEITEETATRDIRRAVAQLHQLKAMGIHIALDDFGTGYSSLNLLRHFPVDTLKIDRSFVRNCPQNQQDGAIVQAMIALGHGLSLRVLSEGVETPEQATWLRQMECDGLQGYYLSRPQAAAEMFQWLTRPSGHRLSFSPPMAGPSPSGPPPRQRQRVDQVTTVGTLQSGSSPAVAAAISSMAAVLQPHPTHHQLQREQLIRSITEKIRQSLHLEDILATIVQEVRYLLDTDRVLLYRFSANWDGRVVQESASPDFQALMGREIIDNCFSEKYVKYYRQGRVRAIEDIFTADIAPCHRDMLDGLQVRANLVMPVAYQDQLWGLLIAHHCRSPRPWGQDELELLGQLAVQSAIAIHQGELYQQLELANRKLQKLSTKDGLTQVANRHCFDQTLGEEWLRLQRTQAPLALILGDIDFFKQYNDTYGHPAGDRCLQQVAQVLQTAARRPGDLVARYGGEEFVILMPDTSLAGARQVANHIQQELAQLAIPHSGSPLRQITLSLGVACQIPQLAQPPEGLVQQADVRLYQAKAAGRNQIKPDAEPLLSQSPG